MADGFVTLQVNPLFGPDKLAHVLQEPRLAEPEYATQRGRIAAAETLRDLLKGCLAQRQGREVFEAVSQCRFLAGFVQGARQMLDARNRGSDMHRTAARRRARLGGEDTPWKVAVTARQMSGDCQ